MATMSALLLLLTGSRPGALMVAYSIAPSGVSYLSISSW